MDRWWWSSTFLLIALAARAEPRGDRPSIAFFYGKPVPVTELSQFDWVVVQAENLDGNGLADLHAAGVAVFAYLSLGEAAPGTVEPSWVLGSNPGWSSAIVNPAAAGWRERILGHVDALWESGYRGLFLDTLDSYLAVLPGAEARRAARTALASLVRAIHERHPELRLFFNRGFEILDDVGALAAGLAAESLLFGWDAAAKRYIEVSDADRKWLTGQLQRVKDRFQIPVAVVDFLPPAKRAAARKAARRIEEMGFTPWISTPALDVLGVGSVEVIPRRVLLLYDGAETPSLEQSPIHKLAALPLEYLGFVPEYADVRHGLPRRPLAGQYAGIVTWFTDDEMPDSIGYPEWLLRQIDAGVPVALLGRPGFDASSSFLARLGLAAAPEQPHPPLRLAKTDEILGLEEPPRPRARGLVAWRAVDPAIAVHLRVEDSRGGATDPVITAPWGGMALDPYLVDVGYQGRTRWIVDPFAFLRTALALGPAPALDLTTENGARLLVVVAGGDGFARPAGPSAATAADVILHQVLTRVPVPTTVELRAGELASADADARSRADRLARAILELPNVERGPVAIASGNLQDAGEPSLSQLSPSGIPDGDGFRVYLPGLNESGASSFWDAARFDRADLVALFERAESPRRLKPLGLYYPFSIATRPAAVRSLTETLRWARAAGALPLWWSEYARRVLEFRRASIALRLDGTWQFRGLGALRTVRVPSSLGSPDLDRSAGVVTVGQLGEEQYVSFGPGERPTLALADEPIRGIHLVWANAAVERWSSDGRSASLRLRGHEAVRFAAADPAGTCTLVVHGRTLRPETADGISTFSLAGADTGEARLECDGG